MRVRLNVSVSGTRNGKRWPRRGETIDLPDHEAAAMCAAGLAAPVPEDRVERAVPDPAEVETRPGPDLAAAQDPEDPTPPRRRARPRPAKDAQRPG